VAEAGGAGDVPGVDHEVGGHEAVDGLGERGSAEHDVVLGAGGGVLAVDHGAEPFGEAAVAIGDVGHGAGQPQGV
jgi:hypothetical protein